MILVVHVKPGASSTRVISWLDRGTVVIALAAPPVDGKANQELIKFLKYPILPKWVLPFCGKFIRFIYNIGQL